MSTGAGRRHARIDGARIPAPLVRTTGNLPRRRVWRHPLALHRQARADGDTAIDLGMCAEALRLARLLRGLASGEPVPEAVLALPMLTEACRADERGGVVLLADQDRSRWDTALAAEGQALLDSSLRRTNGVADPYQLQAAIAAEHTRALDYPSTDWPEIVRLYDLLTSVAPSPAAALNRAVALAESGDTAAALTALETVPPDPRRHAVHGELLARQGRYAEAVEATTAALSGDLTTPERRHRERRRAEWAANL